MSQPALEWEWGCEECEFSCKTDAEAFAHSDAAKHSLAMRPVRPDSGITLEIPPGGKELPPTRN